MSADRAAVALVVGPASCRVVYSDPGAENPSVVAALRPLLGEIRRALAPPLPPRHTWPDEWVEIFDERVAICVEAGVSEAEALAIADAELRVHAWRAPN